MPHLPESERPSESERRESARRRSRSSAGTGTGEIDRLRGEWDALADRVDASPFVRPGWIAAWWRAFGTGRLEILTARRNGSLEAVLPIVHRRGAVVSPANWHTPEFGVLGTDAIARGAILDELLSRGARLVALGFLSGEVGREELRSAARKARHRVLVRTLERSPRVLLHADWGSYEQTMSGNLRRDVERCGRRLRELGSVTLDVTRDTARLSEALALENAGWKAEGETAIVSRVQTTRFYSEIAEWAARRGWLRLIFLALDGRPIAFHFAIEHGGAYFPLKGGFESAFRACSPGKLIIHATLQRAFAIGLQRYELLGDDAVYKRRWANDARDRTLFQAFAPTLPGFASQAAFTWGRPLAKHTLAAVARARAGQEQPRHS